MNTDDYLAKQSIDRLFAEDFEPQWMRKLRRTELEILDDELRTSVEFKWKMHAYEKLQRISWKHPPRKPL